MTILNANHQYREYLKELVSQDHSKLRTVAPRGIETWEHRQPHTARVDQNSPLITDPARKLGQRFAFAEAAWVLRGQNTLAAHPQIAQKLGQFSDNGVHMSGAYGPKVVDQLPYVVQTLADDQDSRQAVINIWRERPGKSKDIPCTISLVFYIRNGNLNCHAMMRSNDIWWGTPYDWFTFTMVSEMVRSLLSQKGIKLGRGFTDITATSRHLYMRDVDAVNNYLHTGLPVEHYNLLTGITFAPEQLLRMLDVGADQGINALLEGNLRMFEKVEG